MMFSGYSRKESALLLMAGILLVFALTIQVWAGFAGDKNWLLLAAKMMLQGKQLYRDIVEVNPPLIVWIYALFSYISMKLGFIQDYQVLAVTGILTVIMVLAVCDRLIQCHPQFAADNHKRVWFIALLSYVFITITSPVYFLDREYIFLILTFPYILRFCPTLAKAQLPRYLTIGIGCIAAIGFCIKPHCLAVFAGLQLLYMYRERSLRILLSPENIAIYCMGTAYLWAILHFTPDYFTLILPMALATYSGYKETGVMYLACAAFSFAATFIDFRLRHTSPYRKDIYYFLCVCVLFLLYALTNNGWGYTYNPLLSLLLIISGWVAWDANYLKREYGDRGETVKRFVFCFRDCLMNLAAPSVLLVLLFMSIGSFKCGDTRECTFNNDMADMVRQNQVKSFGMIGINFGPVPIINRETGASMETRFNHLWMMPKMITGNEQFIRQHQWITEYVANGLAQDMQTRKPDIMIVDASPEFYKTKRHINFPDYFSVYPLFKEAWKHYRFASSIDECTSSIKKADGAKKPMPLKKECKYDIFKRIPNATP